VKLHLDECERSDAIAILAATLPPVSETTRIRYATRTGALLRVDGVVTGAYDREHHETILPPSTVSRRLELEVELRALPTNGLPSGPGLQWTLLNLLSRQSPQRFVELQAGDETVSAPSGGTVRVIGHSHLDVAWLWTYEQTHRKAARTFAIAADLLERDATFVFAQSQPQLYAFVEAEDPQLFDRVLALCEQRRFDPDVAAMWVEPDCNLPSGESLLRQLLYGHRYCVRRLGIEPGIAWLPDSFGFANTLPMLLAHAGVRFFATTKLQWNDTTRFPYPQFVWRAPDGSDVVAALVQSYDGGLNAQRIRIARERGEPVVAGYGDGGGGVTSEMLADVRREGAWIQPRMWFEQLDAARARLPVHADELYLEFHRGVYTTHHDLKAGNALLERALGEAEELAAWCIAVRVPPQLTVDLRERLAAAWEIVLRNQFHDVLPGTSIAAVNDDALAEYARAGELVAGAMTAAQQALPRARRAATPAQRVEPVRDDDAYLFDNGLMRARVLPTGAIVDLRTPDAPNVCTQGNVLALYTDRPKKWEAWNIDAGYQRSMRRPKPAAGRIEEGALSVPFVLGKSAATMSIALHAGEPFLRVELDVNWRERRTLLRLEHWLPLAADTVTYGTPHGTIVRSARRDTAERRAKFEVPGQRFALVRDESGAGFAQFALDTYGWSARVLDAGGLQLGHSLLRGTRWPDERADRGVAHFSYAYAPFAGIGTGAIERAWLQFAHEPRVRLFTCDDDAVAIAACKPAEDGDGIVVRVRECDGAPRRVALRCGARMRGADAIDALERPTGADATIEAEELHFTLEAFALRSFRVRC
jgi:alpha-mannosidase